VSGAVRSWRQKAHTGPIGADEIVDEMLKEVSRHGHAPISPGAGVRHGALPGQHPRAEISLRDLLALDGAEFVELAYQTILGRAPDEQGRRHFLQELAHGHSKVELLDGLSRSAEAQRGNVLTNPMSRRLTRRRYRLPIIGGLLRFLNALPRLPRIKRHVALLRRVQHEQERVHAEHAQALAQVGHTLSATQTALRATQTALQEVQERLANSVDEAHSLPEHVAQIAARLDVVEADESWMDPVALLSERQEAQADSLALVEARLSEMAAQAREVATVAAMLHSIRTQQGWEEEGEALVARLAESISAQRDSALRTEALVEANRRELLDQQRRLSLIMEDLRRRLEHGFAREEVERLEAEEEHQLDALYLAFEDRFRGTRADIKDRQRIYLPLLTEAGAGTGDRPIIDVGSGRGEFLELLKDTGLTGRGVDLNRSMVSLCMTAGLDCVVDDAIAYLARSPADSFGAVTGFHIIEHLPFKVFVRLLDETLRTLQSGGLVIFETPNPANVQVGSRLFYLDPTHRNPIPSEMAAMIAEARGFVGISVLELHPMRSHFAARDTVLAEQMDRLFHGPQDYAVIARKA
jgi:SAM-dependent methyltransferase